MVIGYKKKHLNFNLIFGLIWLSAGVLSFFWLENSDWIDYGYFILGFLYLCIFYCKSKYKYLTITNDVIKVNQPFGWKVECKDIKSIKKFAGDYSIKTESKEHTISGELIEPDMAIPLDKALQELDVRWE